MIFCRVLRKNYTRTYDKQEFKEFCGKQVIFTKRGIGHRFGPNVDRRLDLDAFALYFWL